MNDATRPEVGPLPRAYPVPRSEDICERPYLSYGCLLDVGEVLAAHGFPRPQGYDLVALRNAAEWFLYDSWNPDGRIPALPAPGEVPGVRAHRNQGRGYSDA
ncbi:hypothetical protein AB0I85_28550 [Micromonospora echinofusca]|uniref:hypothetical protein n=1 Tax=Micromonospora echinofusca TaxID=47858 RepID=UPI0033D9E298